MIAIAVCSMALTLSVQAVAGLGPVVSQAYEVFLSDFRPPGAEGGTVAFKQCEDCEMQTVSVSSNTRYNVNGKSVRLAEFRKAIAAVRDRDAVAITVLHHLESDTIVSISVSL
jgi:hypothetical protein